MSLKDIDFDAAFRRLADRRIEEAMAEGKFSNLPGAGKPLELEPIPAEENARMTWWALKLLRQNDYTPDEVRLRKQVDHLRDLLDRLEEESRLESLIGRINQLIHKINTLGTNAIASGFAPLDLDIERARLRERVARERNHG